MTTSITREQGYAGFSPEIVRILTTSTYAQVTTAGWYNNSPIAGESIAGVDLALVCYSLGSALQATALFAVSVSAKGVVTLTPATEIATKVNATEASNSVTANGIAGKITTSSLTTAGGANYAITWTNKFITTSSVVLLTIAGGTNNTQNITLQCVPGNPASGTATLTIYNNTASTALNGTIVISYLVV